MIRTLSIAIVTCAVALLLSAPASAVIYFEENFDTLTDGDLTGQSSSGFTWQSGVLWSPGSADPVLQVGTQYGTSGKGAGRTGPGAASSSWIDFGDITSGPIYLDMDVLVNNQSGAGNQFWLNDGAANNTPSFSIAMDDIAAPFSQSAMIGGTSTGPGPGYSSALDANAVAFHINMVIDDIAAAAPTLTWSMHSLADPSKKTDESMTINSGFVPHSLWLYSATGGSPDGWDNIRIASTPIPEPTSLVLLGLGLAGFCCSRPHRRRRR